MPFAAAATAPPPGPSHRLHDPFSPCHAAHFSPAETTALLDLLAVDRLVDSHASPSHETALVNDLLAVDLEFARSDVRLTKNVATAPGLKDVKCLLLELLETDMVVDSAKAKGGSTAEGGQRFASSSALHDPYARSECNTVTEFASIFAPSVDGEERQLRDNVIMMNLLAMDESVDATRRYQNFVNSDDYAIIGELYDVDVDVSGAKRRALLIEELQGLLDVDHFVDGAKRAEVGDRGEQGKRSIFSAKEKYNARVAAGKYSR